MLNKDNDWLASQVLPDANRRQWQHPHRRESGAEREWVVKTINYRSFYRWSLVSGNASFTGLADQVFKGEAIYKRAIGK
jgi:hypothetical protein